jgi:KipI family sensor histidine kinase inhibitor
MVRPAGDGALLVEAGPEPGAPGRLRALIQDQNFAGIADVVPGAETVLVVLEPAPRGLQELAGRLKALIASEAGDAPGMDGAGAISGKKGGRGGGGEPDGAVTEIPVVYDGPDLAEVAEYTGLSPEEVIERHAAAEYLVGWLGFSPGFGYLTGLDPALHVPRRNSPRTSVPAGSVAIAGPLAAVYPAASPGGWQLLGRTTARLWDVRREPPAVLAPGRRVRFRPVAEPGDPPDLFPPGTRTRDEPGPPAGRVIEVVRAGPLTIVADLGRPGYGHLGVPRSGAADPASLRLANRLVGNPEDAAGLELTLGGAELRFGGPGGAGAAEAGDEAGAAGARAGAGAVGAGAVWVAVTGAAVPVRLDRGPGPGRVGDRELDLAGDRELDLADGSGLGVPFAVPAGATVTVGVPTGGVRSYLAVRGGVAVPAVLGSRSCDTLSGLGPGPLRAGDRLPVGDSAGFGPIVANVAPRAASGIAVAPGPGPGGEPEPVELRVVAGPRDDWFTAEAMDRLRRGVYEVTSDSNRSGLRLTGPELPRSRPGELPSEGMPLGALQVPPSGQPILFLADHPVTGGYPVIAVVAADGIGRAAQLRPGDRVRFRLVPSPLA